MICAMLLLAGATSVCVSASAEQASQPTLPAAGRLDSGGNHSCAALTTGGVRCWGFGADGQLGFGNRNTIGDDESPSAVGPVNLGRGRTASAVSAGDYHTCALLDDGTVRCWGFGADGRLGYGNQTNIDDPSSVGPVNLGAGHVARAISAGAAHTCAILEDGTVRCWGYGGNGRLGYNSANNVGDNETPGSMGPIDLGFGRTAVAISAGAFHTCAILDNGRVRCWGFGRDGQLGYVNTNNDVGDDESPASVGPVDLGTGRTATAISAGGYHTCALLDNKSVRCWGYGGNGRLGYANTKTIGNNETPGSVGPVDLGFAHTATAISAGDAHTCAILDDQSVRCWGYGTEGRLGYASTNDIGDDETPGSAGPVDLGSGRTATAITAGGYHTCARLDDNSVRCWGYGGNGRLGYCNANSIGDDEPPASAGPVAIETGSVDPGCPPLPLNAMITAPGTGGAQRVPARTGSPTGSDVARARGMRDCLAAVMTQKRRQRSRARRGSTRQRVIARRRLSRQVVTGRRRCVRLYARTPGPITGLHARARGKSQIDLSFHAPGTDGNHAPAARSYVIKQSRRPIRSARAFARAQTLCKGACYFPATQVGGNVSITITDLRTHTTYYYALAARDNVSGHRSSRIRTAKATTH